MIDDLEYLKNLLGCEVTVKGFEGVLMHIQQKQHQISRQISTFLEVQKDKNKFTCTLSDFEDIKKQVRALPSSVQFIRS